MPFPALRKRVPKIANTKSWQNVPITSKKKTNSTKKPRSDKVVIKETSLNILSTNARDMKHKEEDLKNKVKYFGTSIFAIQETHYQTKGKFKLKTTKFFNPSEKTRKAGGPC